MSAHRERCRFSAEPSKRIPTKEWSSRNSALVSYSLCLQISPAEWRTHVFPGFSPNRAYCENPNAAATAEGHGRGPPGRPARPRKPRPRPAAEEPKRDARHASAEGQDPQAQEGRREERAAQEEETRRHGRAAAERRRAADGAAGPRPGPGPGGGLRRRRVGHGVRRRLELGRRRRGVPPAGLPLRGAGQ